MSSLRGNEVLHKTMVERIFQIAERFPFLLLLYQIISLIKKRSNELRNIHRVHIDLYKISGLLFQLSLTVVSFPEHHCYICSIVLL